MNHVMHCIDEMAAELEASLMRDQHVRALVQLDEREARGETLTVVDTIALRTTLQRHIENNGFTHAKRKLS